MSYRFMRVMVMFDLPTVTAEDKCSYRMFRKKLIKDGFLMMQESIYVKIAINPAAGEGIINRVEKYKPKKGIIQVLTVTEKQFERMRFIVGEPSGDIVSSAERLMIL